MCKILNMALQRTIIPRGQSWLIERMQQLGYDINQFGMCYGISYVGIVAILLNDLVTFDRRLETFYRIKTFEIKRTIKASRQRYLTSNTRDQDILEIPAFLDGIAIYQQPQLYPHLFEADAPRFQNAEAVRHLIPSYQLEEQGGAQLICSFTGIYNPCELISVFQHLRMLLHSALPESAAPIALALKNTIHAIAIGYSRSSDEWIIIDADSSPSQRFKSTEIFSSKILSAFSHNGISTFSTKIYCLTHQLSLAEPVIKQWTTSRYWQYVHSARDDKMFYQDSHHSNRLHMAAIENDEYILIELLKQGVDPYRRNLHGYSAFEFAIIFGHERITHSILTTASNYASFTLEIKENSLYLAIFYHHHAIALQLLAIGINPNTPLHTDHNPLYAAANLGFYDFAETLLQHGADPSIVITDEGKTPHSIAIEKGHREIALLIAQHQNKYKPVIRGQSQPSTSSHSRFFKRNHRPHSSTKKPKKMNDVKKQRVF